MNWKMKILITEKQYKKLTKEEVKCKCGHSLEIEKDDKNPNLPLIVTGKQYFHFPIH